MYPKAVTKQHKAIRDLEEHLEDQLSQTYQKIICSQTKAILGLKNEHREAYQKTVRFKVIMGLEEKLEEMYGDF